ncbi:MAG: hypothetical protein JSW12_00810 [Deltaproteobacteria bacterium]|nr:MAG: hypothetical protein JSW12_00810 [Deltaproteobacteria bacterium]
MTHEDAGHYRLKHPSGTKLNPKIAEAINRKAVNNRISCASAHEIAAELDIIPADVGVGLDLLETRIINCQLGLFGHSPEKKAVKSSESVSPELEKAIHKSLADNRISCLSCWKIAERFGLARMDVSAACEALRVKVSSCQLGAFR